MRTTLQIEDDVLLAARTMARMQGKSLGQVISELARKGLKPLSSNAARGGFPVFDVPEDVEPMTDETVAEAMEELP